MKKRRFKAYIAVIFLALAITLIGDQILRAKETITYPPTVFDPTMRCRCKRGLDGNQNCYGGNALSFRTICYKGNFTGDKTCRNYDANCLNHTGDANESAEGAVTVTENK